MLSPLVLSLALCGQAKPPVPPAKPAPAAAPSDRRAAELRRTVERRAEAAAKKARQRANQAALDAQERRAQEAYVAKMAPIWAKQQEALAKQQATATRLMIEKQKANAMTGMAGAMQSEAQTDRQRLQLEQAQMYSGR